MGCYFPMPPHFIKSLKKIMINRLAKEIHKNNVEKGFYEKPKNIGEMLALIHSEVSEALECDRKSKYCKLKSKSDWSLITSSPTKQESMERFEEHVKDTFEDELADIMIRVMDLAAHKGVDLEVHINKKMYYNSLRSYKHGKKY